MIVRAALDRPTHNALHRTAPHIHIPSTNPTITTTAKTQEKNKTHRSSICVLAACPSSAHHSPAWAWDRVLCLFELSPSVLFGDCLVVCGIVFCFTHWIVGLWGWLSVLLTSGNAGRFSRPVMSSFSAHKERHDTPTQPNPDPPTHRINVTCFFDAGTPLLPAPMPAEAEAAPPVGGLSEGTRQASGLEARWMIAGLSSLGEAEQPWGCFGSGCWGKSELGCGWVCVCGCTESTHTYLGTCRISDYLEVDEADGGARLVG